MQKYEEEMEKEFGQLSKEKAWQIREFQQQELIENLLRESYEKENDLGDRIFHLRLSLIIIYYLIQRRNNVAEPGLLIDNVGIFFDSVLTKIKKFARTEIERDALVVQLLKKVLISGIHPFNAALLSQEIYEPEKLFGKFSA